MSLRVSLFGCGTIGNEISRAFANDTIRGELVRIYDRNPEKCERLANHFTTNPPQIAHAVDELYQDVDLVVEAAGQEAVAAMAVPALEHRCDVMLLSVGAFADGDLLDAVLTVAEEHAACVHVPSGAIAGLDAIKAAASSGELNEVTLTTTKPPDGLRGASYLAEHEIDLAGISTATTVFEGSATAAAKGFPANINVALALSLAGIGADATNVRIVADPDETTNVHHIRAVGGMGAISTEVRNVPHPTNPKTSYLAPLSVIAKLREMGNSLQTGT